MLSLPDFRVRQRDYLLEIARGITQELNLDKLLKRILQLTADILSGNAGLIMMRSGEGEWNVAASHGIPPQLLQYLDPLLAAIPDHEDPARFEIPKINELLQKLASEATLGLLTGVGLPLIARNQVIGVIFIFRNYRVVFSANDRNLLQSFADQAAIAVSNAQLYTQSTQERQKMSALLDSVADGILILKPNHNIERVNPAFARMAGASMESLIGMSHDEVVKFAESNHGTTLKEAEAGGWPLSPQATLYVEGDLLRSDGSTLPVGVTYAPLLNEEDGLKNIIASARDITHFREAEELKSTFISVVSHELKTPVALIKGYVGTLRREDASWDQQILEDSLAVIEDEADRLAELIDNLLDATRLEAGVLAINATDLHMPTVVSRVVERFKTQTDKHTFVLDFPDDFPVILADENRIDQVLYNLVSNAVKYSTNGGEIRLTGSVQPDEIIICVEDQGQGIAPGDIHHIFDRFYRAESAQRKTKGAGLGLYLSRAVIEAHGGKIWADPRQNEGARICFSLSRQQ
ncbi:MAG TPA: ATP-binding protein [Anaerolineales bacterium]|nr:ATP-binding protein [Anaerolineales bacterium]